MATRTRPRPMLLDPQTEEFQKEILRAFEGGKKSRRTEGWLTTNRGPDSDIRAVLSTLMQRSQDLVDSDAWSAKAISVIINNTIGEGIQGAPLKGTKAYATALNDWMNSPLCDWNEKSNFFGLQVLALRTAAVRGSALVRKRIAPELIDQGLIPLQLQLLEPDYLDSTRDDGAKIVGGKLYSDEGKWLGAYIWDRHPGEGGIAGLRLQSTFVPKSELLHIYEVRRPAQYTGVPWGIATLIQARDIADAMSAQLLKQKLAACFAAFVTDDDLDSERKGDELTEQIEPGLIQRLFPGQAVTFSTPPKVDDFPDFLRFNLQAAAAGWGITYEALTGDLSSTNFSSGRMGWLEFHRNIARWRWDIMIPQMLDPVAGWYRQMAQVTATGRIPRSMIWTPPRREMINPKEEIQYLKEAVLAGFMSLSEVQRSFGYVPQQLMEELAKDLQAAQKLGLALSTDGQMEVGRLQARAFADQQRPGSSSSDSSTPPGDGDSPPESD